MIIDRQHHDDAAGQVANIRPLILSVLVIVTNLFFHLADYTQRFDVLSIQPNRSDAFTIARGIVRCYTRGLVVKFYDLDDLQGNIRLLRFDILMAIAFPAGVPLTTLNLKLSDHRLGLGF
jgi:hypothetical protein